MKLLFDENLPHCLTQVFATRFPGSRHVRECSLLGHTDDEVWEFARSGGFAIVSKDSDFQQRSALYGHPPKVVWLRIGNCNRQQLIQLIATHAGDIHALETSPFDSMLVLS